MYSKRGRPCNVQHNDIIDTVVRYKSSIIISDHVINKIVSKHNIIWSEISNALCCRITPASLYTIVSCNRYSIRDKLIGFSKVDTTNSFNLCDNSNLNISDNTVGEISVESINAESINFIIQVSKHEFEDLIVYKSYKRKHKKKCKSEFGKLFVHEFGKIL